MRSFTSGLRPLNALVSQAQSYTTVAPRPSSLLSRPQRIFAQTQLRYNSGSPRPLTESPMSQAEQEAEWEAQNQERRKDEEAYRITFTCKPCGHRSAHRMSKQGYHRGTVLIQCPSCSSRHVMSDHLGVFFEEKTTLEDLLKEKGQTLTHGHTEGNLEFWEDGSVKSYDLEGKEILGARDDDKKST
ncbi:unnamed protein product [Penicillium viridicatum]